MDTQALHAFLVVADTGSFSVAAERLYLTQPAVSKRIAALESALGCVLLDRLGRHCALTEAGATLYPRAKQVLQTLEDGRRAIDNLRGTVGGRLELGTSHHIGLHRLPPVLQRFNKQFPDVKLQMHFLSSEDVCTRVESGEIELGVVTLPLQPSPHLVCVDVWPDPLEFVVSHSAPCGLDASLEELAGIPAILPERGTYTREIVENVMRERDIRIQEALSTNYLETIKMMVSVGLGWSVLPRSMVSGEVRQVQVENIQFMRMLGAVYHRRRTLSNAAQRLLSFLEQAGTAR